MVDFGDVAADDEAGGGGPGRLAGGELVCAGLAFGEEFFGRGDFGGLVEFVAFEGETDGLVIDHDVGDEGGWL